MTQSSTGRQPNGAALWVAMALLVLSAVIFLTGVIVLFRPAAVHAAPVHPVPVAYTVTETDLAPQMLARGAQEAAQPGDGVIRITERVCGNADNWQVVAAANNIVSTSNPPYLVLLGQVLTVSCTGSPTPPSTPAQPAPQAVSAGWANPLPGACLGSRFGEWRGNYAHQGQDLPAGSGTPIHAAAAGSVSTGWQAGGAGNYTMINHGGGVWTVYMHQSSFAVTSGSVQAGQVIGYVGTTGDSTGPHLHFEVHTGGLWNGRVDPVAFMANRGVQLGC